MPTGPTLTVAVLGATGVYGRHLLPRLAARGHRVRALVRRPEAALAAAACGTDVRAADVFDEASLRAGLAGCDVGVNLATSLPGPSGRGGDYAANDRLRREGTPVWVRACRAAGVPRILQQSVAMVNAAGDAWADEDTVYPPGQDGVAPAAVAAALAMEEAIHGSGLDWLVLRGALFYGPGTGWDDDWLARARAGKLRLPGDGRDWVTLVHIADMAAATVAAIDRWPSRRALIVADDRPVQWRELLGHVAALAGVPPPEPGGRAGFPSFRVTNRRAREALAWAPVYPDFRAGLAR
jgi:nucleoside-diphosphate-sugar epimerase